MGGFGPFRLTIGPDRLPGSAHEADHQRRGHCASQYHRPLVPPGELAQAVAGRWRAGPDRLAACWAAHDEPARAMVECARRNEKMPLAVVLGGDPAFLLAAAAPLPPGVDACALAGLFREKPIDVVACRSVELEVPAQAEIVVNSTHITAAVGLATQTALIDFTTTPERKYIGFEVIDDLEAIAAF